MIVHVMEIPTLKATGSGPVLRRCSVCVTCCVKGPTVINLATMSTYACYSTHTPKCELRRAQLDRHVVDVVLSDGGRGITREVAAAGDKDG